MTTEELKEYIEAFVSQAVDGSMTVDQAVAVIMEKIKKFEITPS